jgi:hypothetical protein
MQNKFIKLNNEVKNFVDLGIKSENKTIKSCKGLLFQGE